jgi:UDP-3-O-[3-hydroxymyristoyl] N-acetylglucosamine deacetylase/3-hydroxyacyl-[acyl-carrier-protein] dehydratase
MAQVGGILLLNIIENPKDHWVYLVGLDNARFKRPVVPGDTLIFRLELLSSKRNICKMRGKAYVDDALVCEAEMTASLVKKNQ